jgi:phage terminase large subunit-like protein
MDAIGLDWYMASKTEDEEIFEKTGIRMVPWGQGFKDMTPAIEAFNGEILNRTLVHNNNPIMTWNVSNTMSVSDPAGNMKVDKSKTRFRIDGAVALIMAAGLKSSDTSKEVVRSAYEDMTPDQINERMKF